MEEEQSIDSLPAVDEETVLDNFKQEEQLIDCLLADEFKETVEKETGEVSDATNEIVTSTPFMREQVYPYQVSARPEAEFINFVNFPHHV